jgi:hypothetical protein
MDTQFTNDAGLADDMRVGDKITHVLYPKLKEERDNREAIIGAGPKALEAIASRPVPIFGEFGRQATVCALVDRVTKMFADRSPKNLDLGR